MSQPDTAMIRVIRYVWALPVTCLGVSAAMLALLSGGRAAVVQGVLEVHGGLVTWLLRRAVPLPGGAAALTLGHVVLGRSAAALARTRTHERVHVRQVERWGPLFLPAYAFSSLIAFLSGRHPYFDNRFEREARAESTILQKFV